MEQVWDSILKDKEEEENYKNTFSTNLTNTKPVLPNIAQQNITLKENAKATITHTNLNNYTMLSFSTQNNWNYLKQ